MKSMYPSFRFGLAAAIGVVILTACSNNNPPENQPTPIPSPEEKPLQDVPADGASQPRDTTFVLPKP